MATRAAATIEAIDVSAYEIPTDLPESDGTLEWDSTTLVLVELSAGDKVGLGYTYGHQAIATLISGKLADALIGRDAMDIEACWLALIKSIRNLGRPGIASMAIAALDIALWDVKARLLDLPLARLLGRVRSGVPVYGSGGFTSYSEPQLCAQLTRWVDGGISRVKLKVGRKPWHDLRRVQTARAAIGSQAELFIDANGAYDRKQALALAEPFAEQGVSWYEEPVTSDDLAGLSLLRDRAPARIEVTAGEYGYDLPYFRAMLEADAVDVLQADITRCAGVSGFLAVAALAEAYQVPLSAHSAPALHVHPCCAVKPLRHLEYFHDHVRVERMLFDGVQEPNGGSLRPDLFRSGMGLEFKRLDAQKYRL